MAWFYTLAAEAAGFGDAPDCLKKGLPQDDVPIVLLGRLAVSLEGQSQELGLNLLRDALLRSLEAAEIIGARQLVVVA